MTEVFLSFFYQGHETLATQFPLSAHTATESKNLKNLSSAAARNRACLARYCVVLLAPLAVFSVSSLSVLSGGLRLVPWVEDYRFADFAS